MRDHAIFGAELITFPIPKIQILCQVNSSEMTKWNFQMSQEKIDVLVPRSQVAREFGVVPRSMKRWEEAKLPGLDEPVVIRKHVYHKRSNIELAKAGRAQQAAAAVGVNPHWRRNRRKRL
jgi:hypothetical protein